MRVVVNEFMSLDSVVQAPGGPGRRATAACPRRLVTPYFDVEVMGPALRRHAQRRRTALRAPYLAGDGGRVARARRRPVRRSDGRDQEVRRLRTLTQDDMTWNTTLLSRDDASGDRRTPWRGRWRHGHLGQRQPCAALLAEGSSTSSTLMIEPLLLGGGKHISEDGAAQPLELRSLRDGCDGRHTLYVPADLVSSQGLARPAATRGFLPWMRRLE